MGKGFRKGRCCLCGEEEDVIHISFGCLNKKWMSQGSSVSIVSGYGLDNRAIEVRYLAEARGFFL
jgi:hypothetical protein